ncbi:uncharacterized protein N7482_002675 [Penicillium canariense]|uniref:Uncharacterized protein n=1 Tax=Penicillium canariense TaxID=189055 RepID=A0A9W9IFP0_9EURO|nr:uncharacterized protein N7482_002675 [Penicillium canariense]KAJ5176798.1 hypothetical protein N7482_002675 [Penicillium canariense]
MQNLSSLGVSSATLLTVRHAMLAGFSPNPRSLGNGAPVPGTAIYQTPNLTGCKETELWTTIVQAVPECTGATAVDGGACGGEPVLVYVGWESVEVHDAYHYTKHAGGRSSGASTRGSARTGTVALAHSEPVKYH